MDRASDGPSVPLERANERALAHTRFARAAIWIYVGAAALAVALLVTTLMADRTHEEGQIRELLQVEADLESHALAGHLQRRLGGELRRLGARSEVDLLDHDLAPEQSLLELSHASSTYFNLGVALLDAQGVVLYSVPQDFLPRGTNFGGERWFSAATAEAGTTIKPIEPKKPDSVLYLVSPIIRGTKLAGTLIGGIDVARDGPIAEKLRPSSIMTVLSTRQGVVVFPPTPPKYADTDVWRSIFEPGKMGAPAELTLSGAPFIVASSPVAETSLVMLSIAKRDELYRPARDRFVTRLATGLLVALAPLVLMVHLLQRSLKALKRSEEEYMREERLRRVGEAANSIAHEVKNALNGLSMGLDMILRKEDKEDRQRLLGELRREIGRLSAFTTELMTFSKGIEPRRAPVDLAAFVPKVTSLLRDSAAEQGTDIEVRVPDRQVNVRADPNLLHVVISNLVGNALEAVMSPSSDQRPHVGVYVEVNGKSAGIRVIDNGAGVTKPVREHLFEPFVSGKPSGVGIGLALSRKIARAHGGDLALETSATGASFLVTLPLEET
jgi:signal transduction histidine kinase